jgi:hypothetical protein
MHLLYLPAYSPDLNPIEEAFSSMKAWIKRQGSLARSMLDQNDPQLAEEVFYAAVAHTMTPSNASQWFKDCGYHPD